MPHFKHKRDIVTVPQATRQGARGEKIPFLASLCLRLRLYKSSGFVRLPGQVWALALRCEVISVMCTQECALSDFPPGFSFSQSCKPRLRLPRGSQTEMSRESISRVPVGFTGAFPVSVDPGPLPNGGCSHCLSDAKQFPSLGRGHPMLLVEGNEAMTAPPEQLLFGGRKFTPSASCCQARQG